MVIDLQLLLSILEKALIEVECNELGALCQITLKNSVTFGNCFDMNRKWVIIGLSDKSTDINWYKVFGILSIMTI